MGSCCAAWSRLIDLPQQQCLQDFFETPGYDRMIENIFVYLTAATPPTPAVPTFSPLGLGVLSAASITVGVIGAKMRKSPEPFDVI